jgi:hypothetical protein
LSAHDCHKPPKQEKIRQRLPGRPAEREEVLEPIYAWINEGFEFLVLRDARSLLIELSEPE